MASITIWSRLEPHARDTELQEAGEARVYDPLWLLGRQYQVGEFQGHDGGIPIMVEALIDSAPLQRIRLGDGDARDYDATAAPLDVVVEREWSHGSRATPGEEPPSNHRLGLRVEAGQHFLRLVGIHLGRQFAEGYRIKLVQECELKSGGHDLLDAQAQRFYALMARRVPDGEDLFGRLWEALRGANPTGFPDRLLVNRTETHRRKVTTAALAWLDWYCAHPQMSNTDPRRHRTLLSEPAGLPPAEHEPEAWQSPRLEYQFSTAVAGRLPTVSDLGRSETVMIAPQHDDGRLDWYSFDRAASADKSLKTSPVQRPLEMHRLLPKPATFPGMPAPRWWQFEDGTVTFAKLSAGSKDLAHVLVANYATVYSNDHFVVPLEVKVGHVCRVESVAVVDTFGQRTSILPAGQVDRSALLGARLARAPWRMFNLSVAELDTDPQLRANTDIEHLVDSVLFLPPAVVQYQQDTPIEEVVFVRDEMANMCWAIERTVESLLGRPYHRYDAEQAQRARAEEERLAVQGWEGVARPRTRAQHAGADYRYRLASTVPPYWIPLVTVRVGVDPLHGRLHVWRIFDEQDPPKPIEPLGRILRELPGKDPESEALLFDEEVSHAGAVVSRYWRHARWVDGSTHVWLARRNRIGHGEVLSGLRFDSLHAPDGIATGID